MKTTTKLIPVSAAICAALVGCEWGGVHSGESWNDAYSWANFTGTYKLVNAMPISSDSGTTTINSTSHSGSAGIKVLENATSAEITGLKTPIDKGSATVTVGGYTFQDNGEGTMVATSSGGKNGTISYTGGAITIGFAEKHPALSGSVTYSYTTSNASGNNNLQADNTPFRWLNLNQKGNLLTIEMVGDDSKSAIFSGKITGASCPTADEEGFVQAGHIRFTFEATRTTNAKQTLTGSISGDWSGSSSARTGTIANRTIDATFHDGRTAIPFQAVSGSTVINAKEVYPATGVTD